MPAPRFRGGRLCAAMTDRDRRTCASSVSAQLAPRLSVELDHVLDTVAAAQKEITVGLHGIAAADE